MLFNSGEVWSGDHLPNKHNEGGWKNMKRYKLIFWALSIFSVPGKGEGEFKIMCLFNRDWMSSSFIPGKIIPQQDVRKVF